MLNFSLQDSLHLCHCLCWLVRTWLSLLQFSASLAGLLALSLSDCPMVVFLSSPTPKDPVRAGLRENGTLGKLVFLHPTSPAQHPFPGTPYPKPAMLLLEKASRQECRMQCGGEEWHGTATFTAKPSSSWAAAAGLDWAPLLLPGAGRECCCECGLLRYVGACGASLTMAPWVATHP